MHPISTVEPKLGKLYFRGIDIAQLAQTHSFEDVCYLLVKGSLPKDDQSISFEEKIRIFRTSEKYKPKLDVEELCKPETHALETLAKQLDGIANRNNLTQSDSFLLFTSLAPVIVTASYRLKHGMQPIDPHDDLIHATNFLWMLHGKKPSSIDAKDFETSLILHMDYPGNPSQSALENSIKSDQSISNSLLAALKEHKHPLHHGAGEYVWKMLQELDDISSVKLFVSNRLEKGKRIFGLGHKNFKTIDPRAVVLREILRRRIVESEDSSMFELVEEIASVGSSLIYELKGRHLFPNLDLYNVVVYSTLNIPAELNTDLFGIARSAGWMAHALAVMNDTY